MVQQFLGESMDKLIFMKKMNEAWSGHCQQIIMVSCSPTHHHHHQLIITIII